RGEPIEHRPPPATTVQPDSGQPHYEAAEAEAPAAIAEGEPEELFEEIAESEEERPRAALDEERPRAEREDGGRRRRRRRRHRGEEAGEQVAPALSAALEDEENEEEGLAEDEGERGETAIADGDGHGRKRRRGRRGGRRGRRGRERPLDEARPGAGMPPPEMTAPADTTYASGNGHQPSEAP